MINRTQTYNPKALNLSALHSATSKVTLGFKCSPELKLALAKAASEEGLTLSQYVEYLIEDIYEDFEKLLKENTSFKKDINQLKGSIKKYENEILLGFFNAHKNQIGKYINLKQEKVELLIVEPIDIYTIIINSFKPKE